MYKTENILFIDTETIQTDPENTIQRGVRGYMRDAKVVIITYAIGEGPVEAVTLPGDRWADRIRFEDLPDDLRARLALVEEDPATYTCAAFNAGFDLEALRSGLTPGRNSHLTPDHFTDVMAQCAAANIPTSLEGAAQLITGAGKHPQGKNLINLFSVKGANPADHPDEWQTFIDYAVEDVALLREVYKATRPLTMEEWTDWRVNERINTRGMPVDAMFVENAAAMAATNRAHDNKLMAEITGGAVSSVTQVPALNSFVSTRLSLPEGLNILTSEWQREEDGEPLETPKRIKLSLEKQRLEQLVNFLAARDEKEPLSDDDRAVMEACELRMYGGSATPYKYAKMRMALVDDRLHGQYVFNGAGQTGRYSSRGIQMHNLMRKSLGALEAPAINDLVAGVSRGVFEARYGRVSRALSMLVRPSIAATEDDMTLVWGDWSAIEARVLPWLAMDRRAEEVLDVFRGNDANPDAPDIYIIEGAKITGRDPYALWDAYKNGDKEAADIRQTGKVAILSLGFGGALGALKAMATNYGMHLDDDTGLKIVFSWRRGNPWGRDFWDALWEAATNAVSNPGTIYPAGRVAYMYDKTYLGGSLLCALPCGRVLTYPQCKWRKVEEELENGDTDVKWKLRFRRGWGWKDAWYGLMAENVTQATAASLLRATLRDLDPTGLVIGHTHDEVISYVPVTEAEAVKDEVHAAMVRARPWAEGLPLAAEMTENWYYTKAL